MKTVVVSLRTERDDWNEPAQQQRIVSKTMAEPPAKAGFAHGVIILIMQ